MPVSKNGNLKGILNDLANHIKFQISYEENREKMKYVNWAQSSMNNVDINSIHLSSKIFIFLTKQADSTKRIALKK